MSAVLAKLLPLGLVLLMLVVGLKLDARALGRAFVRPKGLVLGLLVQWLALPLLAVALSSALNLSVEMRAGLILVALAPGGVTSNYIAYLSRADLALSAAMTLITTLCAGVVISAGLVLSGVISGLAPASFVAISVKMTAVALLPMMLGMSLAYLWPSVAARILRWLDLLSRLIFAAMVLATFAQSWDAMIANIGAVGVAVIALNFGALAIAGCVGWFMRLSQRQTHAIMIEASLQNVAVALFVAGVLLGNPVLSVPALLYAMMMNLTALGQIIWGRMSREHCFKRAKS